MVMPHVIMMVIIGISASLGDVRLYALGCGYLECFIDGLGLGNMEANYECVSNQVLDFFSFFFWGQVNASDGCRRHDSTGTGTASVEPKAPLVNRSFWFLNEEKSPSTFLSGICF